MRRLTAIRLVWGIKKYKKEKMEKRLLEERSEPLPWVPPSVNEYKINPVSATKDMIEVLKGAKELKPHFKKIKVRKGRN